MTTIYLTTGFLVGAGVITDSMMHPAVGPVADKQHGSGSELSICGGMNGTSGERPKLQSCVSIVVDDVDGDGDNSTGSSHYSDSHHHQQFYFTSPAQDGQENEVFDDNADARSDISQCSRGSRGSTSREESESRLQQIKDEVRHRRDEFARLLDEHEQVVRELRRIESSGELQSLVEISSGRAEEALSFPGLNLKQEE